MGGGGTEAQVNSMSELHSISKLLLRNELQWRAVDSSRLLDSAEQVKATGPHFQCLFNALHLLMLNQKTNLADHHSNLR